MEEKVPGPGRNQNGTGLDARPGMGRNFEWLVPKDLKKKVPCRPRTVPGLNIWSRLPCLIITVGAPKSIDSPAC